jgi:hypothetical protein
MGRYYSGDIEGKFWFGLQSSGSPKRFGCVIEPPTEIHYYIHSDKKNKIVKELAVIKENLGDSLEKFNKFFEKNESYSDEKLLNAGLNPELLGDYADYHLGMKILKCVEKQGECSFDAEL